jgi:hypothetical protein
LASPCQVKCRVNASNFPGQKGTTWLILNIHLKDKRISNGRTGSANP